MELTIKLWAKSGKFQELHQTLLLLLPAMRKKKGCKDSHIYRDMENDEILLLSARWDDSDALGAYLLSEYGRAILGAIDMLGETVKIRIGQAPPWQGIEALKRMRATV
jgi:quinol monooxygenase YgiN